MTSDCVLPYEMPSSVCSTPKIYFFMLKRNTFFHQKYQVAHVMAWFYFQYIKCIISKMHVSHILYCPKWSLGNKAIKIIITQKLSLQGHFTQAISLIFHFSHISVVCYIPVNKPKYMLIITLSFLYYHVHKCAQLSDKHNHRGIMLYNGFCIPGQIYKLQILLQSMHHFVIL